MAMTAEVRRRFARVRLLSLDVDGVLTDGGLYYDDKGNELRKYHVRDGMGIKLVQKAGIAVTVISQGTTGAIRERMRKLGVDEAHFGIEDKAAVLRDVCARRDIPLLDVLHVADDVNDLTILDAVGFPVAVADAVPQVKAAAVHITENRGGNGAVRELCDAILAARQETT